MGVETSHREDEVPAWVGSVHAAPGLLAFTGQIGNADAHAHACLQLLVVTSGCVEVSDGTKRRSALKDVAIIPAGIRHQVTAGPDAAGLAAYLDAESRAGRAATARLHATGGDLTNPRTWTAAATRRIPTTQAATAPVRGEHPVLADAIRHATTHPGGPPVLTALAKEVAMSPSRLGHLFADRLGLSYPAWCRWIRLRRAMAAVQDGANLSIAAHAAGFADSAHLTRTTRAMFGITPTQAMTAAGWRT